MAERNRYPRMPDRATSAALEENVRDILTQQRARRSIQTAGEDPRTAYGLACMVLSTIETVKGQHRLTPVESALLEKLVPEIVARAHAEAIEWCYREHGAELGMKGTRA